MNPAAASSRRQGMILLNVLIIVAISAAAVTVMLVAQDIGVRRTIRLHDAAQAQAYSRAGELSAVVALRRDAVTAPETDSVSEPWAAIGQTPIQIPNGRFALSIADEQARFNVNAIAGGDPAASLALLAIGDQAGVDRAAIGDIVATVRLLGPLRDDGPLRTAGVDPAALDRLAAMGRLPAPKRRAQPEHGVAGAPVRAHTRPRRSRASDRRPSDCASPADQVASLGLQGLAGVRSDFFRVETDVSVGDVRRLASTLIERRVDDGGVRVSVIARRRLPAPR